MTEYWKSYAKKFCEICKVWYADNKVSAERHEQGLKHKAMVQQHLRESSKKAREKEVEEHDLKMTLLAMEQAARASISSQEEREVPMLPAPRPNSSQKPSTELSESDEVRAKLREQKRKLAELKRRSKHSQFWTSDDGEGEGNDLVADNGGMQFWTPGNGESEGNDLVADNGGMQFWTPDYGDGLQTKKGEGSDLVVDSAGNDWNAEQQQQLTREQRRKFRRERKALADGPQIPEGLVQLKVEVPPVTEQAREDGTKPSNSKRLKFCPQIPEGLVQLKDEVAELRREELTTPSNSNFSSHPLGPWIPVKKEEKRPDLEEAEHEQKERRAKRYDDLPEQSYGPGTVDYSQTPAELLEIAELDPDDLAFNTKQLGHQQPQKKAIGKVIGFRKPGSSHSTKSLRSVNKTDL